MPAAVFGAGAVTGFFAVSYTIIVFPIALIFLPRLWSIARTSTPPTRPRLGLRLRPRSASAPPEPPGTDY